LKAVTIPKFTSVESWTTQVVNSTEVGRGMRDYITDRPAWNSLGGRDKEWPAGTSGSIDLR